MIPVVNMFQRTISRTVFPVYARRSSLRLRYHRQHKPICYHLPFVPALIQPTRTYAVDIDSEIAKLRTQVISNQEIPEPKDDHTYEVLNLKMFGYNCNTVEHFAQYVHNLAKRLQLKIFDSYAVQTKATLVSTFQAPGHVAEDKIHDFMLGIHERIVQIQDLSTTSAPLFLEILQINLPEGVTLKVEPHSQEHYKDRFVKKELPDLILK